jgi:hypothetical protein
MLTIVIMKGLIMTKNKQNKHVQGIFDTSAHKQYNIHFVILVH